MPMNKERDIPRGKKTLNNCLINNLIDSLKTNHPKVIDSYE